MWKGQSRHSRNLIPFSEVLTVRFDPRHVRTVHVQWLCYFYSLHGHTLSYTPHWHLAHKPALSAPTREQNREKRGSPTGFSTSLFHPKPSGDLIREEKEDNERPLFLHYLHSGSSSSWSSWRRPIQVLHLESHLRRYLSSGCQTTGAFSFLSLSHLKLCFFFVIFFLNILIECGKWNRASS